MPQAVDLPVSPGRSSKPVARANRTPEPTSRFDDILSKRSRIDRVRESDAPKDADVLAANKTDRADRHEKIEKPEKRSKADQPQRDRIDESDDSRPESETPAADETLEDVAGEAPAGEDVEDVVDVVAGQEETDADASAPVDPALASLAVAPAAEQVMNGTSADADATGDDATAAVDPLDAAALTARPATDAKSPASPATPGVAGEALADESADADVQASGLKLPEGKADGEGETSDADAIPQSGATKVDAAPSTPAHSTTTADPETDATAQLQPPTQAKAVAQQAPVAQPQPAQHPDDRFVEQNVDRIVTGIKSDLTPNGGTMKIRLDPPNLGQLNIDVTIDDGVLTASFQTTNDEATRLLSHSMQQLKQTLESAGVSVDRIQVRQASSSEQSSNTRSGDQDQQQHQQGGHDHPERQEQQRREMLQKMWAKLALGDEPLDLVA